MGMRLRLTTGRPVKGLTQKNTAPQGSQKANIRLRLVPCCSSSIFGLSRGVEKTLVLMGVWTRFTARHATRSWRIFSDCTSRGFPVLLQPSASNMALRPLSMFPYRGMMLPAMLPLNLFPGAVGSAIRAAQHSSRPGYQHGSA